MNCFFSIADLLEANSLPTLEDILKKGKIQNVSFYFVTTSYEELLAFQYGRRDSKRPRFHRWQLPLMRPLLIYWWRITGIPGPNLICQTVSLGPNLG